ncbi:MAG TPA: hypothetical protein VFI88_06450 [Sphingomicrobium sp.]|nr:hypothetical protein [Sphingomicrobium sp.]
MNDHSRGPQPQECMELRGLQKGEPWQVQIDVYLDSVEPLKFRVESCLPQKDQNGEKYVIFENKLRPGFRILFQLHTMTGEDPATEGYAFPKRGDDAIWSRIGEECPREYCENKVFQPERVVEPDRTTLVVRFENKEAIGDFRYTLNLVKSGAEPLQLDPGGTGMNGQSNPLQR